MGQIGNSVKRTLSGPHGDKLIITLDSVSEGSFAVDKYDGVR